MAVDVRELKPVEETGLLEEELLQRKRAEEALRIKDWAIASSINAIAFADLEGNLTYVNPSFLKLWGYDDDNEVLGKPAVEFWQAEEKAAEVVDALRDKESWIGELVAKRKDGSLFDVQLSASMVTDEVGTPICMMGSFIGITERKRAEEEIRQRSEELAALYDVSLDMAAQLDLDTLLKTILLRAMELLRANAGGLYLYQPERQELELIVYQGLSKDYTGTRLVLGEGACGKVAQSGEPLVVTDYANWKERSRHFNDDPTFNVLAVPIKRGDTLLGALYVDDPDVERRFEEGDIRLATLFANQAAIAMENARAYERLEEQSVQTITALATAIEARDPYTSGHSQKVTEYAIAIAQKMDLSAEEIENLRMAGLLHEIGKIGIPDSVLNKPVRLTSAERIMVECHPVIAAEIVGKIEALAHLVPIIRHHRERYDGKGYPDGLKGEEIPLLARILAVADGFQAMASERPYRPGMSTQEAVAVLKEGAGTQWDEAIVRVFCRILNQGGIPQGKVDDSK